MATSTKKQNRRGKGRPKASETPAKKPAKQAAIEPSAPAPSVSPPPPEEGNDRKVLPIALTILMVLAVAHAIYFARAILFPIALSVVLYFLLAPLVRLLSRFRLVSEPIAAAIVVLGVSGALVLASYVLSGPVSNWVASAPETLRTAEENLRFVTAPVEKIDEASEKVTDITGGEDKEETVKVTIKQPPITSYLLSATMNIAAGATITIVLVYLLLSLGHRTLNSVVELIPTMEDKREFVAMLRDVEQGISSYLMTITAINLCLGIVIGTALGFLGLPDPILLGIMAAALNFIPYAGCVVGALITFLIGVVYLETPAQALMGPLLYLAINTIEGNVVTPMVLGRSMKLNPVFVFIFIVFWGWVWGIGGVLIAVPLLGILKIVCDRTETLKPVARILTG